MACSRLQMHDDFSMSRIIPGLMRLFAWELTAD